MLLGFICYRLFVYCCVVPRLCFIDMMFVACFLFGVVWWRRLLLRFSGFCVRRVRQGCILVSFKRFCVLALARFCVRRFCVRRRFYKF